MLNPPSTAPLPPPSAPSPVASAPPDCSLIDYAIPHRFVEEILKQHAVDCKLDSRQHVQYKTNIFARQKYYEILKASIDDTKLKLEHKDELY